MFAGIKHFVREEDGAAGVEYALLLTLVAVVLVSVGAGMGTSVRTILNAIAAGLSTAATAAG
ncbi:Flp family type IVb pilin [Cupriavidus sp. PET2-C1]